MHNRYTRWALVLILAFPLLALSPASRADDPLPTPALKALVKSIFPEATEIKPKLSSPPVWPVYQVTELIGYVFLSGDYVKLPGFSGAPFQILVGIDRKGLYRGAKVIEQHEPIFLHGLGTEPMHAFTRQYKGLDIRRPIKLTSASVRHKQSGSNVYIDGITKATASAIVLNETIMLSALKAAQGTGLIPYRQPPAKVRMDLFEPTHWQQLVDKHWVQRLQVSQQQVDTAFDGRVTPPPGATDGRFADIRFAYLNTPTIGRYLLGDAHYQRLIQEKLAPGDHAIMVMTNGPYSMLGDNFVRSAQPDRLALTQNGVQIELRDMDFYNIIDPQQPADMPRFKELRLFRIKAGAGFDPASPWKLSLVVTKPRGYLQPDEVHTFDQSYQLPKRLFLISKPKTATSIPLWQQIWHQRADKIVVLLIGLTILTAIIFGHRRVTTNARLFRLIRWSYLLYTLVFIGYITQGQLSITNVFTILQVIMGDADSSILLIDPVIFILWIYVLLTLVLWGRGYFCGWLCPFGVLQEMAATLAEKLKIRQRRIPFAVHRRLWGLKYLILAGLVAVSFYSISGAERAAEVEPFKTAITLGFVRGWPFVIYAVLLLVAGLFVHKFFCRYLCPLGAFFAVMGHLHLLRWLPRRAECGSPCQLCHHRCGIRAIEPDGQINYRECIQCYECEVIYRDDHQCVPLINARKGKKRPSKVIARSA